MFQITFYSCGESEVKDLLAGDYEYAPFYLSKRNKFYRLKECSYNLYKSILFIYLLLITAFFAPHFRAKVFFCSNSLCKHIISPANIAIKLHLPYHFVNFLCLKKYL